MERLVGILLIVGCIVFFVGAFTPLTYQMVTADPQTREELMQSNASGWLVINLLFGIGSITIAIGLVLFALQVQSLNLSAVVKAVSFLGPLLAVVGTVLWVIISYNRVALPPEQTSDSLLVNGWIFPAFTILMQAALIGTGFALVQASYPQWLGWGMVTLGGLSILSYVVLKDMPPFAHYVPFLIMGITLVVR